MHSHVQRGCSPYQNGQQQSHVSTTEDGKEDSVNHQQDVGGCQWGEQIDQATEDQVGLVIVVFMEQVPVCQPAGGQLCDGLCDTCNGGGQGRLVTFNVKLCLGGLRKGVQMKGK